MRLYLNNNTYEDIDLPLGITSNERNDWTEVLLDCTGFPSTDAASKGNRGPRYVMIYYYNTIGYYYTLTCLLIPRGA